MSGNDIYKIFVINPGSTSTKLSYFENEKNIITGSVFHDSSLLRLYPTINDQLDMRMEYVKHFIEENEIDLSDVDVIMGRGGGCYPIEGGIYEIDQRLLEDTRAYKGGLYHVSMLGVQMAARLQKLYGGEIFMMDPPVTDELCDYARVTGVQGIHRLPAVHALNLKATCRMHAASIGKRYEDCNFIACHIDGGITITAHEKGRMIDGNDGGGGDGPFTPTRMGSMAVTDINKFMRDKTAEEMRNLCCMSGGLSSYFGTSNADYIHQMVEDGDEKAALIWNAMAYQICKSIGSMACVLCGKIDGIILTGGLVRFDDIVEQIRKRCGFLGPISVYVGEIEQEAMAAGALRILRGEEKAKKYQGKPAFEGFAWEKEQENPAVKNAGLPEGSEASNDAVVTYKSAHVRTLTDKHTA